MPCTSLVERAASVLAETLRAEPLVPGESELRSDAPCYSIPAAFFFVQPGEIRVNQYMIVPQRKTDGRERISVPAETATGIEVRTENQSDAPAVSCTWPESNLSLEDARVRSSAAMRAPPTATSRLPVKWHAGTAQYSILCRFLCTHGPPGMGMRSDENQ